MSRLYHRGREGGIMKVYVHKPTAYWKRKHGAHILEHMVRDAPEKGYASEQGSEKAIIDTWYWWYKKKAGPAPAG